MPKFFIERPIFAWVIAIVIMLAGVFAILTLPVEQYPKIAPPSVSISASYPGASAETLENSVTQVIEQKLTGIDYLRYFSSTSDSSGNVQITLTFEPEADPDIAQVQVQNKVQTAMSSLPQEVQQQGVVVAKAAKGMLLVVGVYSKDPNISQYAIADYLNSNFVDPVSRVPGVGTVQVFGNQYSMRIWLNPDKMHSYSITTSDITAAISAQNVDVSAGQLGGTPAVEGQQLNATVLESDESETHVLSASGKAESGYGEHAQYVVFFVLMEIVFNFFHVISGSLHAGSGRRLNHEQKNTLILVGEERCGYRLEHEYQTADY